MAKAAYSPQLFLDPECGSGLGLEPRPPAHPHELTRRRLIVLIVLVKLIIVFFLNSTP